MYHRFTIVYYLVKNISADNSHTITTKTNPFSSPVPNPSPKSQFSPYKKYTCNGKKTHKPAKRDFFPKYSSCKLSVNTWGSLY